jgi:integrase
MAMPKMLDLLGYSEFTVHGFRSTFKDWASDCTTVRREVSEAALAHAVGDAVEQAYRRGDALEIRRQLMDAWDAYCHTTPASNVLALVA